MKHLEKNLSYVGKTTARTNENIDELMLSGKLRIHATTGIGEHYIVPAVRRFQESHPGVRTALMITRGLPDLLQEGYDVSLALNRDSTFPGLVVERLSSFYSVACANPEYLSRQGHPRFPKDLVNHKCVRTITSMFPTDRWIFSGVTGEEVVELGPAPLLVNDIGAVVVAVQVGIGIGLLPLYCALQGLRSGELNLLFPGHIAQKVHLDALYTVSKRSKPMIRAWVDFLRGEIKEASAREDWQIRCLIQESGRPDRTDWLRTSLLA